jgi:hypothetical protein
MLTTQPIAALPPSQHTPMRLRDRLARVVDLAAARAALWPFLATRLAFIVIGLAAPLLYADHPTRTPPAPDGTGWAIWDARWFTGIALHGYAYKEVASQHYYPAAAFFPLYPLAIRLLTITGLNADAAATLIANAAFLAALYYLYRLIALDFPHAVAVRALWLLALFPTALAFFVPYTESPYLLFAVLTFWNLRQRRWLAAGLFGALGALTRQTGLVLLLAYLVESRKSEVGSDRLVGSRKSEVGNGLPIHGTTPTRANRRTRWSHFRLPTFDFRLIVGAVLMPAAVAAHLVYLWRVTGNPLMFVRAQGTWHRRPALPWAGIVATVQRWSWRATTDLQRAHMALELGAVVLFLALLAIGARRLHLSYTVYAGAVWLAALVSPAVGDASKLPLMSSSRFALSVFPSFIMLALLLRRPGTYQAWLTASAMLLGFLAAFFVLGGWVA